MVKNILKYTLLLIFVSNLLVSCTEEIDFDQANDLKISPVVEASLVFFNESANQFLLYEDEVIIKDDISLSVFEEEFAQDNLEKAEFVLETKNSIDRSIQIQVDFLDDTDQLQHTFTYTVAPSPTNDDIESTHTEVFETPTTIAKLKSTTKLVFTLQVLSGTPIDEDTLGRIHLKSKASLYFNIDTNTL